MFLIIRGFKNISNILIVLGSTCKASRVFQQQFCHFVCVCVVFRVILVVSKVLRIF